MLILLRLCCAMLSAYIFVLYMPVPSHLLFRLSRFWGEYQEEWAWYDHQGFDLAISTLSAIRHH